MIDAWQGGAIGFILKPFTANQVSEKLINLFQSTVQNKTTKSLINNDESMVNIPISKREAQVLELLGQGFQQNQVASTLGLSLRTVKMHRTALKNKLNLKTLAQLGHFFSVNRASIEKIANN